MWMHFISSTDATTKSITNLFTIGVNNLPFVDKFSLYTAETESTSIDLSRNEIEFIEQLLDELVLPLVDSHIPFDRNFTTQHSDVVGDQFVVSDSTSEVSSLFFNSSTHTTSLLSPWASPQQNVGAQWSDFG